MDRTLLSEFREGVIKLSRSFEPDTNEKVHSILFTKLYNARCNAMLASYPPYKKTAVDASVGLRDKLKVHAIHKKKFNEQKLMSCIFLCM